MGKATKWFVQRKEVVGENIFAYIFIGDNGDQILLKSSNPEFVVGSRVNIRMWPESDGER